MKNTIFNLEHQYQQYLKLAGLKESDMHPVQKVETRRAFMGACGLILELLNNKLTQIPEDQGVEMLHYMTDQINEFFKKECEKELK